MWCRALTAVSGIPSRNPTAAARHQLQPATSEGLTLELAMHASGCRTPCPAARPPTERPLLVPPLHRTAGALVFEPSSVTIAKGESVTFVNNAGFPHNVVFDEDNVPAGVNAEALGHEDYLNAPGESFSQKFDVAGTYGYYCEPHQGAGMQGGCGGLGGGSCACCG